MLNVRKNPSCYLNNGRKKRLFHFLIYILITFIAPNAIYSQQPANVSVSVKNASLRQLFDEIEKNSVYKFSYRDILLDNKKDITINVSNTPVETILNGILHKRNLQYKVVGNSIMITAEELQNNKEGSSRKITGIVVDQAGIPVIGANIVEKGSNNGTITDIDGNFNINVHPDAVLSVSYIGYISKETPVGKSTSLNITLNEDSKRLEEIVVVGYGTQKKINLTGAVSQVSSKDLENRPVNTVAQMLQGTMPNVKVNVTSGAPGQGGSVSIRGTGSINGSSPLVLVDGIPGDLNRLNPADIETISVLKDAASAAIYGARGAFGVVLVTTKSAKAGKTKVSYDGYVAFSEPTISTDYLTSGYDYLMLNDVAFKNATGKTYSGYTDADMEELYARRFDKTENPERPWIVVAPYKGKDIYNYYGNFDWWDYIYNDVMPSHSHSVNLSGGTEKINYMISGSYYSKDGLLTKNTEKYESFTLTTKLNAQLSSWLKLTSNMQYFDKKYTYPGMEGETNENWSNINVHALPCYAPINPDGSFTYNTMKNSYSIGDGRIANLLSDVSKGKKGVHEFKETLGLEATITKDLKLKADYTFQFYMADDWYRRGKEYYSIQPGITAEIPNFNTDYYKKTMWYDPMHVANAYLNYNKTINDHSFGFTGGINYENKKHHRLMGQMYDLISETLNDLDLGTGDALASGGQYEYELFGAFYRLNYTFKDRYLLEVNGRYDGTSKYKSGKRFGFFPSVSAGWRMSEESWFGSAKDVIDNLKIRASYGSLGNQLSGSNYYPYISSMATTLSTWLINGEKSYNVSAPNPVSDNLTWEKSTTTNLGLDFSILKNRLTFSGDYYIRNTTDMLVAGLSLPGVFGASSPNQNAGDLRTKGYELTLQWNDDFNLLSKPFRYGISASLGDATSEITKYAANDNGLITTYYVGQKIGEIWGYRTDGLFQSDQEATEWNAKVNQRYVNSRIYKSPGEWAKPKAGDVKFLDLDNNGKIHPGASTLEDHGDMEIIGNSTPRYNYSFDFNASWNGFDINAFFQGIIKQDFYPGTNMDRFWGPYSRPYYSFIPKDFANDVWSEDNKDAYFPQLRAYVALDGNCQLSVKNDRYLQNIGFLRFKNLVFGYTLPDALLNKLSIQKLRVYVSGENLLCWSPFRRSDYIDPEQAASVDTGRTYPLSRTFSVGLSVTF